MTGTVTGTGVRVARQGFGRELARTAAVMRLTAQQLRRTATRLQAGAAAARLRVLAEAVLAQADVIDQRAAGLAADAGEMPPPPADEPPPG